MGVTHKQPIFLRHELTHLPDLYLIDCQTGSRTERERQVQGLFNFTELELRERNIFRGN